MSTTPGRFGLALFDTSIGRCGIAWSDAGIVAAQLPEPCDARIVERLRRRAPGAREAVAPADVQRAIDGVVRLLRGERLTLDDVVLDLRGIAPFDASVYALTRAIAPGRTRRYGELARDLGCPGAARAVGQALGRNPFAPIVPCHRVLASVPDGGGFSAHGGLATKRTMLLIEGAHGGAAAEGQLELFAASPGPEGPPATAASSNQSTTSSSGARRVRKPLAGCSARS